MFEVLSGAARSSRRNSSGRDFKAEVTADPDGEGGYVRHTACKLKAIRRHAHKRFDSRPPKFGR
ncbi:MAG: hypothetical protein O9341_13105, partial [Paucibacter sp.]|nr:hypothetical protein [Roseateles sp.]